MSTLASFLYRRPAAPMLRAMTAASALLVLLATGCSRSDDRAAAPEPERRSPAAAAPTVLVPDAAGLDGAARRLAELPFEYSWDLQLPSPVHMSWKDPQLPELVFFQLQNGQIHAIDARSGETQWVTRRLHRLMEHPPYARRLQRTGERSGETRNDDRLYAIAGDTIFCFDAVFGQLIWRHDLASSGGRGFLPSTGPVFQGTLGSQRIFIGDWEGRVQVLAHDEESRATYREWQWNTHAVPVARPVAATDGLTYVGDIEGYLHCFATDRDLRWSFNTVSRIAAPPLVRGRTAYLGSQANVLHVLNRLSGEEIARLVLDGPVTRQPMAFNGEPDRIYVWTGPSGRRSLHSIRTLPDEVQYRDVDKFPLEIERVQVDWSVRNIDRLVSSSPRHLFVTRPGQTDRVVAINRRTGVVDWHWDIDRDRAGGDGSMGRGGRTQHIIDYQDPRDAQRSIFTVDADGYIVAYRLFGQF